MVDYGPLFSHKFLSRNKNILQNGLNSRHLANESRCYVSRFPPALRIFARVWDAEIHKKFIIFHFVQKKVAILPFDTSCVVSYECISLYRAVLHALFFEDQALKTIICFVFIVFCVVDAPSSG